MYNHRVLITPQNLKFLACLEVQKFDDKHSLSKILVEIQPKKTEIQPLGQKKRLNFKENS